MSSQNGDSLYASHRKTERFKALMRGTRWVLTTTCVTSVGIPEWDWFFERRKPQMSKFPPRAARQGVILGLFAASLLVWPALGADDKNAIPDLSGVWGRDNFVFEPPESGPGPVGRILRPNASGKGSQTIADYTSPILKPEAAELLKKRGEMSLSGQTFPTPADQCRPEPTPYILAVQFEFQILQQKDHVTIIYMADHKVRHVRLNGQHPAHVTPSWSGDSIGHYEGDTLVIDTVGIKAGPLSMVDWDGTPHSSALHVVERYRSIDGEAARQALAAHESKLPRISAYGVKPDPNYKGNGLRVQLTVDDPGVFTTPWSAQLTYRRALGDFAEVVCAESDVRSFAGTEVAIPVAEKPDF